MADLNTVAQALVDDLRARVDPAAAIAVLTLALGNLVGNVAGDGQLAGLLDQVFEAIGDEAAKTMGKRDVMRADQQGRQ